MRLFFGACMIHLTHERCIVAHRGYRARFPENTMSSFKAALDLGVSMIELDATLTKDGHVVVIHDETLDRTTNGSGPVREHTLSELEKLDAGSWFSSHFKGERLPTLSEVLNSLGKKISINIEIKPEAFDETDHEKAIERQVISSVMAYTKPDSILVSSFHPGVLTRIARMAIPNLRIAYLTEHVKLDDTMLEFMKGNKAYSWNPDYPVLSQDQVARAHASHIRVMTYTVNRASEGNRCFEMGVDGLFTDEPRLF